MEQSNRARQSLPTNVTTRPQRTSRASTPNTSSQLQLAIPGDSNVRPIAPAHQTVGNRSSQVATISTARPPPRGFMDHERHEREQFAREELARLAPPQPLISNHDMAQHVSDALRLSIMDELRQENRYDVAQMMIARNEFIQAVAAIIGSEQQATIYHTEVPEFAKSNGRRFILEERLEIWRKMYPNIPQTPVPTQDNPQQVSSDSGEDLMAAARQMIRAQRDNNMEAQSATSTPMKTLRQFRSEVVEYQFH